MTNSHHQYQLTPMEMKDGVSSWFECNAVAVVSSIVFKIFSAFEAKSASQDMVPKKGFGLRPNYCQRLDLYIFFSVELFSCKN